MGRASAVQADALGEAWVGPGRRSSSDGLAMVSQDGLRVYRYPKHKPSLGYSQANFEWRDRPSGMPVGNGHLDIDPLCPEASEARSP